MPKSRTLASRVHRPLVALSLICFLIFGAASYLIIKDLVIDSVEEQANATIDIFTSSIRDDILNGFDSEVFSKCQYVIQNTLVSAVAVNGLDQRTICRESELLDTRGFILSRNILFNSQDRVTAGSVRMQFESNLVQSIISRVLYLLVATLVLLLFGYWFVSNYLVRRQTKKLTKLAKLLTESDIIKLETCSNYFPGDKNQELVELCNGVEKLSKNWRAYQNELVRNEKLKAVNESSRILAHDIKSPLGAIKSVSEMLVSKPDLSKKLLDKGLARIETMLSDIVSRDDKYVPDLKLVDIEVGSFFEVLKNDIIPIYRESCDIKFINQLISPITKCIDADLVERAVRNLVKNAFEALEGFGEIRVFLKSNDNKVELIVEDNGPGLPKSLIASLGDAPVDSMKADGSGLGLYQVKTCMNQHNGNMHIETSGSGTKVRLIF